MNNPHLIKCSLDDLDRIDACRAEIRALEAIGTLKGYSDFVQVLFKQMNCTSATFGHAVVGVTTEASELLDIHKKEWVYGKEISVEHLIEELGDLRFYYQKILNMLCISDEDVRAVNMSKLLKRYPDFEYADKLAKTRLDKPEKHSSSFNY